MKAHLSKDELALFDLIEEFQPKEEDPAGIGMDMIKKFLPSLIPDKSAIP